MYALVTGTHRRIDDVNKRINDVRIDLQRLHDDRRWSTPRRSFPPTTEVESVVVTLQNLAARATPPRTRG